MKVAETSVEIARKLAEKPVEIHRVTAMLAGVVGFARWARPPGTRTSVAGGSVALDQRECFGELIVDRALVVGSKALAARPLTLANIVAILSVPSIRAALTGIERFSAVPRHRRAPNAATSAARPSAAPGSVGAAC